MANEINVLAALSVFKPSVMSTAVGRGGTPGIFTMTGTVFSEGTISIALTPTAFPLGAVTQPHWAFFQNLDPTNMVQLIDPSSSNPFARLLPGEFCVVPLDQGYVPTGLAHVAACVVEFLIVQL